MYVNTRVYTFTYESTTRLIRSLQCLQTKDPLADEETQQGTPTTYTEYNYVKLGLKKLVRRLIVSNIKKSTAGVARLMLGTLASQQFLQFLLRWTVCRSLLLDKLQNNPWWLTRCTQDNNTANWPMSVNNRQLADECRCFSVWLGQFAYMIAQGIRGITFKQVTFILSSNIPLLKCIGLSFLCCSLTTALF